MALPVHAFSLNNFSLDKSLHFLQENKATAALLTSALIGGVIVYLVANKEAESSVLCNEQQIQDLIEVPQQDMAMKAANEWDRKCAASRDLMDASKNGDIIKVQQLLSEHVHWKIDDWRVEQAMCIAAGFGHRDIVGLFIAYGAPIDMLNSCLYSAVCSGQAKMVEFLVAQGANPQKATLLQAAACSGNLEVATFLLDHGADVNYISWSYYNHCYVSPLQEAIKYKEIKMTELLLERGANLNLEPHYATQLLQTAIEKNCIEIVALLLAHGVNPNDYNLPYSFVPLAYAFSAEYEVRLTLIKLLLEHGSNPNASCDYNDETPLRRAMDIKNEAERLEIVKLLLAHRADPNAACSKYSHYTPLCIAICDKDIKIIQEMLAHGANLKEYPNSFFVEPIEHYIEIYNNLDQDFKSVFLEMMLPIITEDCLRKMEKCLSNESLKECNLDLIDRATGTIFNTSESLQEHRKLIEQHVRAKFVNA